MRTLFSNFRNEVLFMPAMTTTEKILPRHAGNDNVMPGDNIWVDTDILMTHDVCGPGTIGVFKQHFGANAKPYTPCFSLALCRALECYRRMYVPSMLGSMLAVLFLVFLTLYESR